MQQRRYEIWAFSKETEVHVYRWLPEAFGQVYPGGYRLVELAQLHPKADRLRPIPNIDFRCWQNERRRFHHYEVRLDHNNEDRQRPQGQSRNERFGHKPLQTGCTVEDE